MVKYKEDKVDASHVLIVAHVYENQVELKNLLNSIQENPSLQGLPVLVMNNARNAAASKRISRLCEDILPADSLEVNKYNWPILREEIINALNDQKTETEEWLNQLELGNPGWNVHYARNIGMVIAKTFFSDCTYVLNFDSDIVIPEHFQLNGNFEQFLSAFKIDGCPDMSRLEWIVYYGLFLNLKYRMGLHFTKQLYIFILTEELSLERIASMIATYSNLEIEFPVEVHDWQVFPTREEYHGASYVMATNKFGECPFPGWYDNDWYFFKELRSHSDIVNFLPQSVVHVSAQKNILDEFFFFFEERGKIINAVYEYVHLQGFNEEQAFHTAIKERKDAIDAIATFLHQLQSDVLSEVEARTLDSFFLYLEKLNRYVQDLDQGELIYEINEHLDFQKSWRRNFFCLSPVSAQKNRVPYESLNG